MDHPEPPSPARASIDQLVDIVATLRAPGGCPWDREQTHSSLRGSLLEETHEVIAAIESGDRENLREELGDLLLHVVFHSQIERELGTFTFEDVAAGECDKMIRRHPHVFGPDAGELGDSGAVLTQWEELKKREKGNGPANASVLDNLPPSLPTIMRAQKAQDKAARLGFDWPVDDMRPVLAKLREEIAELEEALAEGVPAAIEDELGDLFFSVVNVARRLRVDGELAAHRATEKFIARFRATEIAIRAAKGEPKSATPEEWDTAWEAAKAAACGFCRVTRRAPDLISF